MKKDLVLFVIVALLLGLSSISMARVDSAGLSFSDEELQLITDRMLRNESVTPEEKLAAYPLYNRIIAEQVRENPPAIDETGGPDVFGYVWRDNNNEPTGPVYNWIDIGVTGTNTGLTGDDMTAGPFNIGFNFSYYGTTYTQFKACTNGWISLGTAETSSTYSNTAIPNTGTPNNSLMPLWDDMYVDATLGHYVKYQTLGLDTLVVQWNVEHLSGTVTQLYQIILTSSGTVTFQYNTMDASQLTYTIGIENSTGTDGLQVCYNPATAYAVTGRAVRFSLPCNMVTLNTPANNGIQLPVTTTLGWTGSTCSDNYDVYFGTNQALVNSLDTTMLVASAITTTMWDPPGDLLEGTSYYWRVVSRDTAVTPPDLFASTLFTFRTFSPGISGTRTIGGTNPDYATIQAAIDAVNASGCGTGVTFLIRGGIYEEAPDSLVASALSSPNSPIVFKPADTLGVTINVTCTAAARQAYAFVNADNIIWDGSHPDLPGRNLITVNAVGTDGYYGFRFANGSDGCKIKNIDVTVGGTTSSYRPIYIYYSSSMQPAAACANDTVQNCKVTGGYYGMYIYGSSTVTHTGIVIEGNDVVDFNYYGMYIYYTVNSKFSGNQLHRTSASTSSLYAIYNPTTSNVGNLFDRNWIYDLTPSATGTVYGMYMVATGTLITNNMINLDATTGGTVYGIYVSTGLQHVYNNSVRIGGSTAGSYSSYALYISGTNSDSIVNNIFVNDRSSTNMSYYHVGGYLPSASPFAYSDHNLWSNDSEDPTDNKYAIRVGSSNYNTLGDLIASGTYSFDASSLGIYPNFVGAPNLHINPLTNTPVESNGLPIAGVSFDFDSQLRNAATPDIGCDEGDFIGGGDFFRPRVSHVPLGRTDDTGPRVAMATITDNVGLATGTAAPKLYYRRSVDPTFTMVSADSVQQDSIFYFTIAGQPLTTIVEYYLAAQDTSGNLTTLPGGGSGLNPPGSTPPATPFTYDLQMVISGTRTIGGTNPDFATITDAITALNNQGTGSGITFLIRGGTYEALPDSILAGANGAPNRPIIFKPADTTGIVINVTPVSANPAYGYSFVNCDNVIFDGSHPDAPGRNFITVNVLGTYGYYGFVFANGSDNCKIKNVNINLQQSTSSTFRPIYTQYRSSGLPLVGCNYDTIENCNLTNGYYSMYLYWTSGSTLSNWYVANNDVYDFYYYGIYQYYLQNSTFVGNRIHRSGPSTSAMYALYASTGTNNNRYIGNRIYDVGASGTATCYGFYSTSGTNQLIANNMFNIDAVGGGTVYGIYKSSNANGKLYYNTVRIGGSTGGSYNSSALYYSSASTTDSLANNIWINERTGGTTTQYQVAMYVPNTAPFAFSDNNIYSTVNDDPTDNRNAIRVGTTNYNTLDDARTGGWTTFDASSLGIPPAFVGAQDLHINPTAPTPVESAGRPIWNVLTDFDNQARNDTTSDIGCDEGAFLTGNDLVRPRITHDPLGTTESPAPRTLQAYIADNIGISTGLNAPRVYHKLAGDTIWAFVNPTSVQDSNYTFTIPGYPLGSVVNYYIAAQDDAGNNVTHPYNGSGSNPPGTIPPPVVHTYFIATLLTGVQTIGATGSNYTSIDQAITAVNSIGVGTGGVTFLIRAGTYDENSSSINCYLDAARPVVFRADSGANVIINKTAANGITAALRFRGASYVTFDGSWPGDPDGRHITINNTSGNTHIVWFSDSTDHNTVKNCVLNFGPTTSSTNRVVQVGNTGTQPELPIIANRIENNDIIGGYYCVYAYGNTTELVDSTYIVKNDIRDFYYYGLYSGYANGMTITYNHIYHVTASASSTIYGMYLTTGSNNHWIHGNRIDQLQGSATGTQYGMYAYGTSHLVSSNMIALGGGNTGTCYGMYKSLANGNLRIEFNTINLFGTTTSSSSYCLYSSSSSGTDSLWGNIFQNTRTGGTTNYHVGIYVGTAGSVGFSDYNLFWTGDDPADNRWAARLSTTNINTVTDLIASATWAPRDQFSFGELPPFVSDTNVHIRDNMSTVVESGAAANGSVLFDVDGDARIPTGMYDIGADEGTFRRVAFGTITGVVYDSIPTRPAMAGVTVSAGRYSTVTDESGNYTLDVRTGVYDLRAAIDCYLPTITAALNVDSGQVVRDTVYMYQPHFQSDQTSVEFQLSAGETRSTTLIVSNTGNGPLGWSARVTALPPVMRAEPQTEPSEAEPITTVAPDGSSFTVSPNPTPAEKEEYEAWVAAHLPQQQTTPPAIDQHWGPDGYGYSADDIAEATFPSWFTYTDIRGIGTQIFSNVDIGLTQVYMNGFSFDYYGVTWDSIWVNTNGLIQFSSTGYQLESGTIPSTSVSGVVAAHWRDQVSNVTTYYDQTGDVYIVQWDCRYYSGNTDSLHYQIQLHGNTNGIIMQYTSMQTGGTASAGIQNNLGTNNEYISCVSSGTPTAGWANYGLAFSVNGWQNWLVVNPTEGVVGPRSQAEIFVQVTADSTLVAPLTLNGSIAFNLQYHCPASVVIPVTSQVVGVAEIASQLPYEYKLHQNYPNPFNPTTEIRFDLKQSGYTKLTVFDLLGRQVGTLVNENLTAGKHAVRYDATRIAAGVYFYRIESGSFQQTRKMVLVK